MTPPPTVAHLSPRLESEQPTLSGINEGVKPHPINHHKQDNKT